MKKKGEVTSKRKMREVGDFRQETPQEELENWLDEYYDGWDAAAERDSTGGMVRVPLSPGGSRAYDPSTRYE